MGSVYYPGRKMQPPLEAGARKALASSAAHQCCSLLLCCICAPFRANPHTHSSPPLDWLAVGLSVYPWEEVHRDFSLIGTMNFRTARDILMASQISIGNHMFYQVQLYNNEQPFQNLSVTGSFRLLYVHLFLFECSISLQVILSNKGKGLSYYFNPKHQKLALIFSPSA